MSFLPTNATSGFLDIPTCFGKPTGTPSSMSADTSKGVYDAANKAIWIYDQVSGEWIMPYPVAACRGRVVGSAGFSPTQLAFDAFFDPNSQFYSDNGTTLAVAAATVQLGKNQMNAGASLNMSQSTSGARATYRVGSNSKAWIEFDGSRYYASLTIPCTAGLCTAHLLKFTNTGYHNVYDNDTAGGVANMLWVDGSGKLELNANGASAAGPYNDGTWRSVITYSPPNGTGNSKMWVDGTLVINSAALSGTAGSTLLGLFNRPTGTAPYKGGCGPFGFGSFDPTNYVADLTAWMLAQTPT